MTHGPEVPALDTRSRERVLVADDDVESATELITGLTRLGHEVVHVTTGGELIGSLKQVATPNIVLSATLPDIGPEPMCRRLRSFSADFRVVVVLPSSDELDTVLCLEAGADDCIGRPYRPREVMARLAAIGRRQQHTAPSAHPPVTPLPGDDAVVPAPPHMADLVQHLEAGDLQIDIPRREVRVNATVVDLTRKEFDLLALLVEHRSFVVSRELIVERVWNGTWSRRTIDTHVASLRSKLDRPAIIQTVRGVGFKLSA